MEVPGGPAGYRQQDQQNDRLEDEDEDEDEDDVRRVRGIGGYDPTSRDRTPQIPSASRPMVARMRWKGSSHTP